MGCGGSKATVDPEDAVVGHPNPNKVIGTTNDSAVDPLGFFKEAKDSLTVSPTTKGSCERCGEDVLDTQNRDKTESGNYVHLLPDHCPVLAKEANWKHRQTTFEEEIEDATQAPTQAGSQQVETYDRPKKSPSEAGNETEYVALDITLQNKAEQETYATFEPGS